MFDSLHILFVKATSVVVAFFLFLGISVTQPSQHVRVPEKQNAPQQIKTATEMAMAKILNFGARCGSLKIHCKATAKIIR